VETTNLAPCHQPLLDLIQSQIPAWRVDTRASPDLKLASGDFAKRGWTIRNGHNIMGGMAFIWNKPGNAWYCLHFWEHYAFGRDKDFLAQVAYPMMKETCEFWEDTLKPLPDGRLVVPKVWSPEHGPEDSDGTSYGQEWVWDLFTNYIEASTVLGIDADYRGKVSAMRDKLLVPGVGSWGQLMEWMTEQQNWVPPTDHDRAWERKDGHIDTPQDTHRHTSHLVGVYPGRQISFEQTPKLAAAALVSVKARGNKGGIEEWSWAVRGPIYARLYQGDLAYSQIECLIASNAKSTPNLIGRTCLFDAGPGITATFVEMLVQSHQGDIHVLPALTQAWPDGWVKGVRARGGYEVDASWKEGSLSALTIRSISGHDVKVRYGEKSLLVKLSPGESAELDGDLRMKS
jgi:alpha-L-fucosidase 2